MTSQLIKASRSGIDKPARVLIMPASNRHGSLHRALAQQLERTLAEGGDAVALLDLRRYPLPLYDGDLEMRDGVPEAAHAPTTRVQQAQHLILVSPEYNGTFTALLKNTIDWMTRVDKAALAHLTVLLAAASPGRGGGKNGLDMLRTWLSNMGVTVAAEAMTVPSATLPPDQGHVAEPERVAQFLGQLGPLRARV